MSSLSRVKSFLKIKSSSTFNRLEYLYIPPSELQAQISKIALANPIHVLLVIYHYQSIYRSIYLASKETLLAITPGSGVNAVECHMVLPLCKGMIDQHLRISDIVTL